MAGDRVLWRRRLVAIHKLKNDRPDEAQTAVYHRGRSVHPERQTTAHPHCVRFSQDGRWLIVPDLGTDEIVRYPFDVSSGDLAAPHRSKVPAGSGPRLAFFSADGRHLVCVYELASEVATFAWVDGELEAIERCATTQICPNTAAGFRWHPSGGLFGVSNRGADTIALFRFEPESGIATPSALASSGGVKPRDFDFSPCGRWLLAANQDSDSVVVIRTRRGGANRSDRTPRHDCLTILCPLFKWLNSTRPPGTFCRAVRSPLITSPHRRGGRIWSES